MSSIQKYIYIALISFATTNLSAQDPVATFMDMHGADDNLEIISIGRRMFEKMDGLPVGDPELKEAIKGLETIRIVTSKDTLLNKEYYDSAHKLLERCKGFEKILSINEEDRSIVVLVKETKGGAVKELLLLSGRGAGFNLVSMSGDINLNTWIKYSEGLNIEELNNLVQ